jgi:PUA domain protein
MRQRLRKRDAKAIKEQIKESAGIEVAGEMDRIKIDGRIIVLVDKEPLILEYEGRYYLTVYGVLKLKPKKWKVVVDEGAIPYIMNGADIMKPGIVYADNAIKAGDFVFVTVEGKDTPIAVGIALIDAAEIVGRGKAVKNIHHLKDKIWNYLVKHYKQRLK